ncbi:MULTISPECIES: hypothetical protein [unclassified Mesorhizobium]|uniref:hypothetical protein n=1 Tax=unclassified Mesorhizobium TaxID=325217 RepID=UPI000FCAFF33|nr:MULTISPECIES: hypothetical protein [unclassified Mesorhizobium]RUX96158.1 hypothetical protein EN993_08945 [Mesorhizobium sp. M7D.F.Ca.US.004.01.2.1]RVA35042.1 hypothetical protein EN935_05045 [Mesorhizobium sp. M7D.F.Ca.US.004.03.1.1]
MTEPLYRAGHRFEGPDGQGYELIADVVIGEFVKADQFKALNGAPEPEEGKRMPEWLSKQVVA